jgi:hypothetical protein
MIEHTLLTSDYINSYRNALASPVHFVSSLFYKSMKAGVKPMPRSLAKTMFDGIEVDIIAMGSVILVVSYGVLPKTTLPEAFLTALGA